MTSAVASAPYGNTALLVGVIMAASIIGQLSVTTSVQDVVFISNPGDFLRFAIVTTANVVNNAVSTSFAVA